MLLFMDGQAHYDSAGIAVKYSAKDDTAVTWAITAEGRFGNSLTRTSTAPGATSGHLTVAPLMTRTGPWTPTASGVVGFAIKVDDLTRVGTESRYLPQGLINIMEGEGHHLALYLNASGTFSLNLDDTSTTITLLAQSTEGLQTNAWAYVECKWVIDASVGSVEVRVNTVPVLTYTGRTRSQDIFFPNLGVWTAVRLWSSGSTALAPYLVMRLCDLYLADLTAPDADDAHDFLGDGIIETIMPDGVGASTGWTPTGAAANWDATNDRPAPDGDSTYVSTTPAGTQDSYHFEDIPIGSVVKGVHWNLLARKEEEGSVVVAPVYHESATDYVGPSQGVASISYDRYLTQPYDINPATGAPWTAAEVNAGIWGVKKVL